MSYQSENSLTDVNVICTVLWPKTARSSPPPPTHTLVIDRGAPSVTEHSTCFYYKKTVSSLVHRRSPGTADTLWTQYGKSTLIGPIRAPCATQEALEKEKQRERTS